MIVRTVNDGLVLFRQADHARVASAIVAAWQADGFPDRPTRDAVVFATAHHDDGWQAEDLEPRWDPEQRRPYDFISLPHGPRQSIWRRALPGVGARSTYAAALVAQHAVTITRTSRVDPQWAAFLGDMERARDDWFTAERLGGPLDPRSNDGLSFLRDYAMIAMGDLVSLIFCNAWDAPYEQEGYALCRTGGERILVSPDPFGGREIQLQITGRVLRRQTFDSQDALLESWRASSEITITGSVVGADRETLP